MKQAPSEQPVDTVSLDEARRPLAPKLENVTEAQRSRGRSLAAIHRSHLRDIARIAMIIARIRAGDDPPDRLMQVILDADMMQNYQAFGTLCGQECRVLTFHHDAEEHHLFPELEAKAPVGIQAVIAKLRAEHKVVHAYLERLTEAAATLIKTPSDANFDATSAVFEELEAVVRSHFRYEETELEEAIGVFVDGP
ncbi:MAG: hemerythrin domain-containing protein [Pseudomonadota bacterium]